MTEKEWMESANVGVMLRFLEEKLQSLEKLADEAGDSALQQKHETFNLRLYNRFPAVCCRRLGPLLDARSKRAINRFERARDWSDLEGDEWEEIVSEAVAVQDDFEEVTAEYQAASAVIWMLEPVFDRDKNLGMVLEHIENAIDLAAEAGQEHLPQDEAYQTGVLRCLFHPFGPDSLERSWLNSKVKSIAKQIHKDRAFQRMPILGDALEEAGCSAKEVLEHCRNGGEHVRGCWVIDLILGKE